MPAAFNPYETLGVGRDADAAAIKRAHREAVKRAHPDKPGGDAEEFAQVQRAWLILSDPKKRSKYDRTGEADEGNIEVDPDAGPLQLIAMMIGSIISDPQADFRADLRDAILQALEIEVAKVNKKSAEFRAALVRAQKLRGRFSRRKDGPNKLDGMVEWHERQIEQAIEKGKAAVAQCRRAQEIIAEYDFQADPQMLGIYGTRSSTFTTSTIF